MTLKRTDLPIRNLLPGSKPYHHGDLKETLLGAALDLMTEKGSSEFSIRDISKKIGVTHAAAYRHFAHKEALLALMAEKGFSILTKTLKNARLEASDSHSQGLKNQCRAYLEFAMGQPTYYRLMFAKPLDSSKESFQEMAIPVQALIKEGTFRKMPLANATTTIWASLHGVATLTLSGHLKELIKFNQGMPAFSKMLSENIFQGLIAPS